MGAYLVRAPCGCYHQKKEDGSSVTRPCGNGGHETLSLDQLMELIAPCVQSPNGASVDSLKAEIRELSERLGGETRAKDVALAKVKDLEAALHSLDSPPQAKGKFSSRSR